MTDIDFRLIQGAITVAEELNMSRAAEVLGITQPALTKRMHDLEGRLGVALFNRTNRGVELTDPCRAFVEDARLALVYLERAVRRAKASADDVEDVLHMGRSPYINPYYVTILTSLRLALYPKLQVELSGHFSSELSKQVMARQLDLALIVQGTQSPLLNYLQIDTKPLFVLFRQAETQLANRVSLTLADLDRQPWALFGRHVHAYLHDKLLQTAKLNGVNPSTTRNIQTAEEGAQLVSQFGGVAFLTPTGAWRAMEPGLTIRPLQENSLSVRTVIVTRANDESRLLSEFVRSAMRRFLGKAASQQPLDFPRQGSV